MKDNDKKNKRSKHHETFRAISNFSQMGISLAATILVSVLLGRYLDRLFGTSPWLLLVLSFLGVGAAIKSIFDHSKRD